MSLEHSLKPDKRVFLAYTAYLVEVESARLTRCNGNGPSDGVLAWSYRLVEFTREAD